MVNRLWLGSPFKWIVKRLWGTMLVSNQEARTKRSSNIQGAWGQAWLISYFSLPTQRDRSFQLPKFCFKGLICSHTCLNIPNPPTHCHRVPMKVLSKILRGIATQSLTHVPNNPTPPLDSESYCKMFALTHPKQNWHKPQTLEPKCRKHRKADRSAPAQLD